MGGELAGARVRQVQVTQEPQVPGIEDARIAPPPGLHRAAHEHQSPGIPFQALVDARQSALARELGSRRDDGSVITRVGASLADDIRKGLAEAASPRLRMVRRDDAELNPRSLLAQTLDRIDGDLFKGRAAPSERFGPPDTVDLCVLKGDPTGQEARTVERAVEVAARHALYKLARFQSMRPLEEITGAFELISSAPELREVRLERCGLGEVLNVLATMEAARRLEPRNYLSSEPARKLERVVGALLSRLLTLEEHERGLQQSDEKA